MHSSHVSHRAWQSQKKNSKVVSHPAILALRFQRIQQRPMLVVFWQVEARRGKLHLRFDQ